MILSKIFRAVLFIQDWKSKHSTLLCDSPIICNREDTIGSILGQSVLSSLRDNSIWSFPSSEIGEEPSALGNTDVVDILV